MKKSLTILTILALVVLVSNQCMEVDNHTAPLSTDVRGGHYAGIRQCQSCHREIVERYMQTSHYRASSPVSSEARIDSVTSSFAFANNTTVRIALRDSGWCQEEKAGNHLLRRERMDIKFGDRHAYTYLYWQGNNPYELPLSYLVQSGQWVASPGFAASEASFNRVIGQDCFECHSSYIKMRLNASTEGIKQELDKTSLIYGVDCERCHGPAVDHVNFHRANPRAGVGRHVTRMHSLSRQQQLDACAVCHSGNDRMKRSSRFEFMPGDSIENFFFPGTASVSYDVHGNQFGLLKQSVCFLGSVSLSCATCHDPHSNTQSTEQEYSKKCMACHQPATSAFCSNVKLPCQVLQQNCLDCHMPKQASQAIRFNLPGGKNSIPYLLRTHRIAIYDQK